MEQKRGRGRPRNQLRVDPGELPGIALRARNRDQLMAETGLSQGDARALIRVSNQTIDEFADEQRGKLQTVFAELLADFYAEKEKLSPMQKAIALGIIADKLNQAPKAINQALHLHIKGDTGSALAAILGPAAKPVFQPAAPNANMTEVVKIKQRPGPIIDAETTETS